MSVARASEAPLARVADHLLIPPMWILLFCGLFAVRDAGSVSIAIAALAAVGFAHVISLLVEFRASRLVALFLVLTLLGWLILGDHSPSLMQAFAGAMVVLATLAAFVAAGEAKKGHGLVTPVLCMAGILVAQAHPSIGPVAYLALVGAGAGLMIACGIRRSSPQRTENIIEGRH